MGTSTAAWGQTSPLNDAPQERPPLAEMTDEELRRHGFSWETSNSRQGSWVAGVVAIVPGVVGHGLGHLVLDDNDTFYTLLIGEGIGLGLVGAGLLLFATADNAAIEQVSVGLGQLGGALFVDTYLADVIGSLKGTRGRLPDVVFHDEILRPSAGYRMVETPDTAWLNMLALDMDVVLNAVTINVHTDLDARLKYLCAGTELSLQGVQGQRESDFIQLWTSFDTALFDRSAVTLDNASVRRAVVRVEIGLRGSLDLGQFIPHLSNVITTTSLGGGFANNAGPRAALPGNNQRAYFTFDTSTLIPVYQGIAVQPFYVYSESELLSNADSVFGLIGTRLRLTTAENLDVVLEGAYGQGVQVGATLRYHFL